MQVFDRRLASMSPRYTAHREMHPTGWPRGLTLMIHRYDAALWHGSSRLAGAWSASKPIALCVQLYASITVLLLLSGWLSPALAGQVQLAWNATTTHTDGSPATDLAGYALYWQTSTGAPQRVDVGNKTTYTLTGLTGGTTYTVQVTAYNTANTESSASNSVTVAIPLAAFSATPTTGPAPLAVQFTDASTGNLSTWTWSFGDGTSSTTRSPQHTYTTAGTYTASLTVTGPSGSDTKTATITVTTPPTTAPPIAAFSATPTTGSAPLAVQFTDASTGNISTWAWSFGDGTSSTARSPQHTYTAAGTYTASLTVTGPGGSATKTADITVTTTTPPPTGSPAPGGLMTLEAETMTLTGYRVEQNADASGGALISRLSAPGTPPGVAMKAFPGPAGTYDIIVAYFDESDGQSTLTLRVKGQVVDTWQANADLPYGLPNAATRTYRVAAHGFSLAPGDVIALEGYEQGSEWARVDNVDFVPVNIQTPVAAYNFNASSGTTAVDVSGNGNTGVLTNGPLWVAGKNGNGVRLDGVNDYIDLGNPAALRLTGSMTLSAWINSSAFPFDDAAIISKRQSANVGYQLDTTIDRGPRTVGFKISDAAGNTVARYGATTLVTNTWYHVAGVYDATNRTLTVYLNGQLDNGVLVGTIPATQPSSTQNVNIGQRPGAPGTFNFAGVLDDVRIYNQALSQAEIQTDMGTSIK
jgi:PKD repeat protein